MQEWLNWHAWKACEPLKGSAGSNPALSANNVDNKLINKQTPNFTPNNVRLGVCLVTLLTVYFELQGIPLIGLGKASVVTECKVENGAGWNVASRFGFEFRNVGQESQKGA
jgi:hypothetical protein